MTFREWLAKPASRQAKSFGLGLMLAAVTFALGLSLGAKKVGGTKTVAAAGRENRQQDGIKATQCPRMDTG